ncbi:MAG: hypothetical protein ACRDT0_11900 [Pseudonocardiaceae bacterium]
MTGANGAPVMCVRYRPGVLGESARAVHLVALPVRAGAGAISALCGALLALDQIETVEPGQGMPCTMCLLPSQRQAAAGAARRTGRGTSARPATGRSAGR